MTIISHSPWTQPQNGHRDWQLKFLFIRIYHKLHNMHGKCIHPEHLWHLKTTQASSIAELTSLLRSCFVTDSAPISKALNSQHFASHLFNWKKCHFSRLLCPKQVLMKNSVQIDKPNFPYTSTKTQYMLKYQLILSIPWQPPNFPSTKFKPIIQFFCNFFTTSLTHDLIGWKM